MPTAQTSLLRRNDTILGVCEAIGQDFGFHANWLRVTLAGLFYFYPFGVIGAYLAMGALVAISRWVAPDQAEVGVANAVETERGEMALAA